VKVCPEELMICHQFPNDKEQQVSTTEPAYSSKSNSVSQQSTISITADLTNIVQQLH